MATATETEVKIPPPNWQTASFRIIGTTPYVQNRFGNKAMEQMCKAQSRGQQAARKRDKEAKDFKAAYEDAMYKPVGETWPNGALPCMHVMAAMNRACKLCGIAMTDFRVCFQPIPDGYDESGYPLWKITKGKPSMFRQFVGTPPDIRVRPKWEAGWEAVITIRFNANIFTLEDLTNLLMHALEAVGLGEGRASSKKCVGQGWGQGRLADK